jgi:hypothetical protein
MVQIAETALLAGLSATAYCGQSSQPTYFKPVSSIGPMQRRELHMYHVAISPQVTVTGVGGGRRGGEGGICHTDGKLVRDHQLFGPVVLHARERLVLALLDPVSVSPCTSTSTQCSCPHTLFAQPLPCLTPYHISSRVFHVIYRCSKKTWQGAARAYLATRTQASKT